MGPLLVTGQQLDKEVDFVVTATKWPSLGDGGGAGFPKLGTAD